MKMRRIDSLVKFQSSYRDKWPTGEIRSGKKGKKFRREIRRGEKSARDCKTPALKGFQMLISP